MTVRWKVAPGEARSITAALQALMMQTRNEPGCAGCAVSTQMGGHPRIDYVEDWSTESDLKRQIRSDRFASLAELMEHATELPVVTFDLPTGTRCLDYAEEVRRSSDLP